MTPERIAELRARLEWIRANRYYEITLELSLFEQLLTAAEERERIAELVMAGTLAKSEDQCSPFVRLRFNTTAEARKLHDLLAALTQEPKHD